MDSLFRRNNALAIALIAVFAIGVFQLSGTPAANGSIIDPSIPAQVAPDVEVLGQLEVFDEIETDISSAIEVEILSSVETRPPAIEVNLVENSNGSEADQTDD